MSVCLYLDPKQIQILSKKNPPERLAVKCLKGGITEIGTVVLVRNKKTISLFFISFSARRARPL